MRLTGRWRWSKIVWRLMYKPRLVDDFQLMFQGLPVAPGLRSWTLLSVPTWWPLRWIPAKGSQHGMSRLEMVELGGLEPPTPSMPLRCSPS